MGKVGVWLYPVGPSRKFYFVTKLKFYKIYGKIFIIDFTGEDFYGRIIDKRNQATKKLWN